MIKLITIDGLDGSGKETLTKELIDSLSKTKAISLNIEELSFPWYESSTGREIYAILHNSDKNNFWVNNLNSHSTFLPSERKRKLLTELFIMNRYEYFSCHVLNEDTLYIADRYAYSNYLYQTHGLSFSELGDYIRETNHIEFDIYKNPKPIYSFFLRVPYNILRERLDKRIDKDDSYESDSFLQVSYYISEYLVQAGVLCPFDKILNQVDTESKETVSPIKMVETMIPKILQLSEVNLTNGKHRAL